MYSQILEALKLYMLYMLLQMFIDFSAPIVLDSVFPYCDSEPPLLLTDEMHNNVPSSDLKDYLYKCFKFWRIISKVVNHAL